MRPIRLAANWKVRDWRYLWLRKRARESVVFRGYVKPMD